MQSYVQAWNNTQEGQSFSRSQNLFIIACLSRNLKYVIQHVI